MSRIWRSLITAGLMCVAASCSRPSTVENKEPTEPRGRYLVERVAMCADCHTPRNRNGELDRTQWLQGSALDFQPAHAAPNWAGKAPGIAGLPKLGDAAVIKLLETGLMPDGKPARPPMPQYRLSHDDAAAVADYLKSLVMK